MKELPAGRGAPPAPGPQAPADRQQESPAEGGQEKPRRSLT